MSGIKSTPFLKKNIFIPLPSAAIGLLLLVTFGYGHYVTVGSGSREGRNSPVFTSQNGTSWAAESSWTQNSLNGVAYGNERFVAVGNKGTILMSTAGNSEAIPIGTFRNTVGSIHVHVGNRSVFTPPSFKNTTGPVQVQLYSVSGRMIYTDTKKPAGNSRKPYRYGYVYPQGNCK